MYEYQVTLVCTTGQYRPVSCIVKSNCLINLKDKQEKMKIVNKGIKKICLKRYWTQRELNKYSYKRIKVRKYDEEIIQLEAINKYRKAKSCGYAKAEG